MTDQEIKTRLEELRVEIRAERISYGEIAELENLAEHIDPSDVELLEWAGVPEFPDDNDEEEQRMKIETTITVKGENIAFPVEVDERGMFSTTFRGEEYEYESLRGLHQKLGDAVLASRVEIPFYSQYARKGVIRGYHAGQNALLVTWANGEKGNLSAHERVFPDLSEEQIEGMRVAGEQLNEAQARWAEAKAALGEGQRAKELLAAALGEDITVPSHRREEAAV